MNLEVFEDIEALKLDNFKQKPTSITKGQLEAIKVLWESIDKTTQIGLWECSPGKFTADRSGMSEYCKIFSGSATVQDDDGGNKRFIKQGDLLVLPIGWKGSWLIHSQIRKFFIITNVNLIN